MEATVPMQQKPAKGGRKKYLKIPYTYVRLIAPAGLTFLLILFVSLYYVNNYRKTLQSRERAYIELLNEYNELNATNNGLKDKIRVEEYKSDSTHETLQRATAKINEQDTKYSSDIEDIKIMAEELRGQLNELEKAKEDIINQLKKIPYLPGIASLQLLEPAPMAAVSYSNDLVQLLGYQFDSMSNLVDYQAESYSALTDAFHGYSTLLVNYPSTWPVKGKLTSTFGPRKNPWGGIGQENHTGLDISVPMYTDVKSTGGGKVVKSEYAGGYGYLVVVDHGMGLETYYGHNSQLLVSVGETISRGQVLAKSGSTGNSTGPHVHYEVRINGRPVNPADYVTLSD